MRTGFLIKLSLKNAFQLIRHRNILILLILICMMSCQAAKQKSKNEQEKKLTLAIEHFEREEYDKTIQILELMRIDNEKVREYLAQSLLARNGIDSFKIAQKVYAFEVQEAEQEVDIIKDVMSLWPEISKETRADLEKAKDIFESLSPFSITKNRANLSELFFYKTIFIVYLTKEILLDLERIKKYDELSDTVIQAYLVFKKDNLSLIESELYQLIQLVEHLPPKSGRIISRYIDKVKPFWDYKKVKIVINFKELGEKFLQDMIRKMIDIEFEKHKKLAEKYISYTNLNPDEFKDEVFDIIGGKQKPSEFILRVIKDKENKLEKQLKDKLREENEETLLKFFFEMAGK